MKLLLDLVAGARPNFVKLAPVHRALRRRGSLEARIVHTGQHYDDRMSRVFLDELGIPEPDVQLKVGSGSHGEQTGRILERYERLLLEAPPTATVVFGDVNSTIACALAAAKLGLPVVHVEAGLRSFDRTMPEEINRILTDALADLLLVSEPAGVDNLAREGVDRSKVHLVGNVMIDSLQAMLGVARESGALQRLGLRAGEFALLTLHRPSNVDSPQVLERLLLLFRSFGATLPIVFPVHPRTREAAARAGLGDLLEPIPGSFLVLPPVPYVENLALMSGARVVLTDSGGMQEETSALAVPCLTLRDTTERPATVELGTSRLVGNDPGAIAPAFADALAGRWPRGGEIPFWDGKAGPRIVTTIEAWLRGQLGVDR